MTFTSANVRRDIDHAERLGVSLNIGGGVISLGPERGIGPDPTSAVCDNGAEATRSRRRLGSTARRTSATSCHWGGSPCPSPWHYARFTSNPKFIPNSDTEIVDEATSDSLKTTNNS